MKYLRLSKAPKVAIVYRSNTPNVFYWIKKIRSLLPKGARVTLGPHQIPLKGFPVVTFSEFFRCDLIIALGGDGTYLRAHRLLHGHSVPILGIHLGTLGFLTPNRTQDLPDLFKKLLAGKLVLLPRTRIRVQVHRNKNKLLSELALNDVVLERGELSQLIHLKVSANDDWLFDAKADGIIVSTPVGSTAYNLAVGGPLLHPEAPVLSLSLIAPHSLTTRPIVVPDTMPIRLEMAERKNMGICGRLVIDGQVRIPIEPQDIIEVFRDKTLHYFVRDPQTHEFQLLRQKLHFGERD
ncbi:MAG: NAD(+)/NADH kinase [Bdellovibrionaceae bacterium]|nr:NAD(+)/NADH kinase [Pseudobdellovibrionaceae bacterium]MDW8190695.1 NAD(+)/NADH kinase [Pseudobdellovibrionaceae bacterium]